MDRRNLFKSVLAGGGVYWAVAGAAKAGACPTAVRGLEFEVYRDERGEYRWRLWSENGNKIAASGEGYRSRSACMRGIEIVRGSFDAGIK